MYFKNYIQRRGVQRKREGSLRKIDVEEGMRKDVNFMKN